MCDVAFAVSAASLVAHDGKDVNRPYIRSFVTEHGDLGQFSNTLYGLSSEGQPTQEELQEQNDEHARGKGGGNHRAKCENQACRKDHRSANNLMEEKIKKCKEEIAKSDYRGNHFWRNSNMVSPNLEEVLTNKTIYVWQPHLMHRTPLRCWNPECPSRKGKSNKFTPSVNEQQHRVVEDLDDLAIVIYPKYRCNACDSKKSAMEMDALEEMGVSLSTLKRCPVVSLKDSAWSKSLYDFVLHLMPTKLGGGDVAGVIEKMRTKRYLEEASIYLQEQTLIQKQRAKSGLHLNWEKPKPFPSFYSHCDGYFGSLGPSEGQINRVFIAAASPASLMADGMMQSLGGKVLSADATFYAAHGLKVPIPDRDDGWEEPVETVHCGKKTN